MLNTIGYEGASLSDFLQTLSSAGVSTVIDIRDRAQSRRAGFSKTALSKSLADIGVGYIHLRELGDPKEGRVAARSNDLRKFRSIYEGVLRTIDAQVALERIAQSVASESVCLLCYERDQTHCHRAIVADRVSAMTGEKIRHLGVRKFEQDSEFAGRVSDTRKGASAPK
jgi:uncharacterized protein (DUF488 family)